MESDGINLKVILINTGNLLFHPNTFPPKDNKFLSNRKSSGTAFLRQFFPEQLTWLAVFYTSKFSAI